MATLNKALRNQLEKVVAQARTIAVAGAERALNDELAVGAGRPWQGMSTDQAKLRNDLRAHGRQLGDNREPRSGEQETRRLVQACAYEHWNRMLFARFLAENNLLLDPEHGLSLTIDDVQELAREQAREWMELASELAQRMLLSVFNPRDPVLRVKLPVETRLQLDQKLALLPSEVFLKDDSLGWVYQFWQKDEKERVNRSKVKIGGDELPAVTQLFTEDYMVLFLLENTLGAWWTAKRGDPKLSDYEWIYLRLNEDGTSAAGSFDHWPRTAREITVLDPCMGSGHFLSFALPILARMRQEEEELSFRDAVAAVLRDNLFGLELDPRCSQIAAFNLALTAWRLVGEHFPLPRLNLACSGLGVHATEVDWVALAGEDGRAQEGMRRLYSLFKDAPTLGSLIDPLRLQADVVSLGTDQILPLLERALNREQADQEKRELIVAAEGVLAAFRLLARKYTLVATNVPYLGRGKQNPELAKYCEQFHPDARADLATCFLERCSCFTELHGAIALVMPQNWLYQVTFRPVYEKVKKELTFRAIAKLGSRAFEKITGEVVKAALVVIESTIPGRASNYPAWDCAAVRNASKKAEELKSTPPRFVTQQENAVDASKKLKQYARCYQGISTGDNPYLVLKFWELPSFGDWAPFQVANRETNLIAGRTSLLRRIAVNGEYGNSTIRGRAAWGKRGVAVARISSLACSLYDGDLFANTIPVIIPDEPRQLDAIWTFVRSPEFRAAARSINQSLSIDNGYLEKVDFDLDRWSGRIKDEDRISGREILCSDPTQWVFTGRVPDASAPLHVAVARLLGFRWPRQTSADFPSFPTIAGDDLDQLICGDGILCFAALDGRGTAEDRLRELLAAAYGVRWSASLLQELLANVESLDVWLKDMFFAEHCALFAMRPFIWHVWDGNRDGFHAFVNYHNLAAAHGDGRKTLERLTYTYLNSWIERKRSEVELNLEGAESRLASAMHLQSELKAILDGDPPYDLFVRWKCLSRQAVGWQPDVEDGIRANLRPWLTAKTIRRDSSSQSCILRVTPDVQLSRDDGKEPWRPKEDFPWFWGWDERTQDFAGGETFDGARWNDLHYSNEMKRKARAKTAEADASKS